MALSMKLFSILFLLALFSMEIQAREFFSKVSPSTKETTTVPEKEPEKEKQAAVPTKEEQPTGKQEQEPTFIPQTENGYGLYGHESGQLPPSTTTTIATTSKVTYEPYVTPISKESQETAFKEYYPNDNNNKNYYYNKDAYENEQQNNLGETRFTERGYTTEENQNKFYNGYNNNVERQGMSDTRFLENGKYFHDIKKENNYPSEFENSRGAASRNEQQNNLGETRFTERGYTTEENQNQNKFYNGYNNNVERQGMSDTRFMENGKYFHDIKNENNYPSEFENSRGAASRNEYSTRVYYGSDGKPYNTRTYYGNNENENAYNTRSYYGNKQGSYNSMGRFQNEEFEDSQDEFEP